MGLNVGGGVLSNNVGNDVGLRVGEKVGDSLGAADGSQMSSGPNRLKQSFICCCSRYRLKHEHVSR